MGPMESNELEHLGVEEPAPAGSPARRRRFPSLPSGRRASVIAAVAGALLVGGIGAAVAQTGGSSTPTTQAPNPSGGPGGPGRPFDGPRGRFGPKGGMGGMGGPMGAIHGEFVVPNGSNSYRTVDTQRGAVASVSSDSITVKSDDGFSKTYGVDENTVVDSGRDGIGTVKNGDTVVVLAAVSDGKASAMSINDLTTLGNIRQHWRTNTQAPPTTSPPT